MIAIVTDSTSYFTKKDATEMNITFVPVNYNIGGRTFDENYVDLNFKITDILKKNPDAVTTSHAPIAAFKNTFAQLIGKGCDVLCIVISSRLSGAYSSACIAAKEIDSDKVMVVDSLSTAGGLQLLVGEAAELAKSDISLTDLYCKIESIKQNVGIVFSVDDMNPLRKSGRMGIVKQSLSTMLNIRPILACLNGSITSHGFSRGRGEQISKLVDMVPKNAKKIIVHYIENHALSSALHEKVKQSFPNAKILLRKIGPVLEVHVGSGAVGISWITPEY